MFLAWKEATGPRGNPHKNKEEAQAQSQWRDANPKPCRGEGALLPAEPVLPAMLEEKALWRPLRLSEPHGLRSDDTWDWKVMQQNPAEPMSLQLAHRCEALLA